MNAYNWGSRMKLLYTKVQLNSEGALLFQPVEAYRLMHRNTVLLLHFSCVVLPPVGLPFN